MTEARRANAARYRELFAAKRLPEVEIPADQDRHCYHQFLIHLPVEKRDEVLGSLREQEIGCAVYYPIPLHLQPCFKDLGYAPGSFPVAEKAALSNLALPIYPELRPDEQEAVVDAIAAAM